MTITYLKGDATNPQTNGNKIIVHVCNNQGGWGKGFVLALSKKWSLPEQQYRFWFKSKTSLFYGAFHLGNIAIVQVAHDVWVVNMLAQKGYGKTGKLQHRPSNDSSIPLQYDALELCLTKVAEETKQLNASVHMPRIGCGLAGGDWNKVEAIINETCEGIDVFVYDLCI